MLRFRLLIGLALLASLVAVTIQPTRAAPPPPVSPLITSFVLQTDSEFGYQMLRPANWDVINLGDARGYFPVGSAGQADRVLLLATNYQTVGGQVDQSQVTITQLAEFTQNPSLEAWAAKREQDWKSLNLPFKKLGGGPPNAAIYALTQTTGEINIVAYIVSNGQPLVLSLYGFGAYASVDALTQNGLVQDFLTMVASVTGVANLRNMIDPPLIEGAHNFDKPADSVLHR
jgi:hypothetical protein